MGLGSLFARVTNIDVRKQSVKRTLVAAGALFLAMPFSGEAQTVPTFVNGTTLNSDVCSNTTLNLTSYLKVNDPDVGQTLTWSVSQPPQFGTGTIVGLPDFAGSGSTSVAFPGTVTFQPASGYTGPVSFQIRVDDGVDGFAVLNVAVTVNGAPTVTLATFPSVCTGTTSTTLNFTGAVTNVGLVQDTFLYKGLPQSFAVPTGVTSIDFEAYGGDGGRDHQFGLLHGGRGGKIMGSLSVTPLSRLNIYVGGEGDTSLAGGANQSIGGGGASYDVVALSDRGGPGGGASDIRIGGTALSNRVVVAGGGGGNGWNAVNGICFGGDGGGTTGIAGCTNPGGSFAKGGTPVNGGAGAANSPFASGQNGALGGGTGGDGSIDAASGGGGGGWFGGGGGAASGGGGGSSYANSSLTSGVTYNPGGNDTDANGLVIVRYLTVGSYSIAYSSAAHGQGFVDVPSTYPLPTSSTGFPISIPPGTAAAIYSATLTVTNGLCTTQYPFTVQVKQTPDVNHVNDQTACNGTVVNVNFATTKGTSPLYTWNNNNTASGAPANGTGNISYTSTNTGVGPSTSVFTVTPSEFGCTGTATTFAITTNPQPSLTISGPGVVCAGSTSTQIAFTNLVNVGTFTNTFSYMSGNTAPQVFTVPANVTSVTYDVIGGNGGSDDQSLAPNPGKGGRVQGVLNVASGNTLNIYVGSRGFNGSPFGAAGGYNGGGNAIYWPGIGCGGAGGGASDIRLNGIATTDRVVVAGGGGGNGYDNPYGAYAGGDGGGLTGGNSAVNIDGHFAGGGSQVAGGFGATFTSQIPGSNGGFGFGGDGSPQGVSGGGGGGFYGGGGGVWTGGGGGSSYSDPVITTLVNYTPGFNIGDGIVNISYTTIGTYDITWSSGATVQGFTNVTDSVLPSNAFNITVPAGAAPGTYTGTFTLKNGLCTKSYPISVIVNAKPDVIVTPPGNQVVCNNDTTLAVAFTNSVASPTVKYIWMNDNTSIGLAAEDSVDIPSFTAINTGTTGQSANLTITPIEMATGCIGAPVTFSYSVNPTPHLTTNTDTVCSSTPFTFTAASAVSGTTFTWSRPTWPSINNPAQPLTAGDINETLDNVTDSVAVTVPYLYNLLANGCKSAETVLVTVKPTPVMGAGGLLRDTVCDGTVFNNAKIETSRVPSTVYTWTVNFASGSTVPPGNYGPGMVTDVLGNIQPTPITVKYDFHLIANGVPMSSLFMFW